MRPWFIFFALVTLAETFNSPFILRSIIQIVDDSGNQTLIQFKSHTPL